MLRSILKFLINLPTSTFLYGSVLLGLIGDLLLAYYIFNKFSNFELFKKMMSFILSRNNISIDVLDQTFLLEQFKLMVNTLTMLLVLFIMAHVIIYIVYIFGKAIARNYFKLYAYLSVAGFGLLSIESAVTGHLAFAPLFLVQTAIYLLIALGITARFSPANLRT